MAHIAVAIDGPTGAGKTTLARLLAADLGFTYVDTGAMYRAVGLFARSRGADPRDGAAVAACLPDIRLDIRHGPEGQRIMLDGRDVSNAIRGEAASRDASDVSAIPAVRDFLLEAQRDFARRSSVVMEGRDIATVVLPQADVKIFLTGTSLSRALRRQRQLAELGQQTSLDAVHQALLERDHNDSTRATAPLRPAPDSIIFDTTQLGIQQVRSALIRIVKEKTGV